MNVKKMFLTMMALLCALVIATVPAFATGGYVPVSGSANAEVFGNMTYSQDQSVYDQTVKENYVTNKSTETFSAHKDGYGAFHMGPSFAGKGFGEQNFEIVKTDTCTVAFGNVVAVGSGMEQNGAMASNAAAGASATGWSGASSSYDGCQGTVQAQFKPYQNGGGGFQAAGQTSSIQVSTWAGLR